MHGLFPTKGGWFTTGLVYACLGFLLAITTSQAKDQELFDEPREVLYISGYTSDIAMPREAGGDGRHFLQKPFTAEALERTVRELLDHHQEG